VRRRGRHQLAPARPGHERHRPRWRKPTDAWNNAGENFDCTIDLNSNVAFDAPKLCTVLAHELGHLLGHPHAEQPGQLMSPVYSEALPVCGGAASAPAPTPALPVAQTPVSAQGGAKTAVVQKTAKGVKVTDTAAKRSLRRTRGRCVRTLKAGKRGKRCARIARRASRPGGRAHR
jgi:hypothetical protein